MKKLPLVFRGFLFILLGFLNSICTRDRHFDIPVISTDPITSVTTLSAISGGSILNDNTGAVIKCGVCWNTSGNPTIDDKKTIDSISNGIFKSNITGLYENTVYHVRAYVISSGGTAYGLEISFITESSIMYYPGLNYGTVSDVDGNIYKTILIGKKRWMAENLRTTKYINGDSIGTTKSPTLNINSETSPKYQWAYNGNDSLAAIYGRLYTWYAATDSRNICPAGWHVASYYEWRELGIYLGGGDFISDPGVEAPMPLVGGKLKEAGTVHWQIPNTGNNESGFTGLPGGQRWANNFTGIGYYGFWWSSTTGWANTSAGWRLMLRNNIDYLYRGNMFESSASGYSIRCVQDYPTAPEVTTMPVQMVTSNSAVVGIDVTSDGNGAVTDKGIFWAPVMDLTVAKTKLSMGTGEGSISTNLTGLEANTDYYIRAYAINSAGTSFGNIIYFTTNPAIIPSLSTKPASLITQESASSGGNITNDNGAAVKARGVCWSISPGPTISDSKTNDGTGAGEFISSINGLTLGNTYYVRAYATNSAGTAYGDEINFKTTIPSVPSVISMSVSSITSVSALSGGIVEKDGGAVVTARGVCWNTTGNPTIEDSKTNDGTGTGNFTSSITGLSLGNTYYVRTYATNLFGTAYGSEVSFTTALALGETFQGGIIAYILKQGDHGFDPGVVHGLIMAPFDQIDYIKWNNGTNLETKAMYSSVGYGNINTIAIVNTQGEGNYAAKLCFDLVLNGYDDWYLPDLNELLKLYNYYTLFGGFRNTGYWSSTEESNKEALSVNFGNGGAWTMIYKESQRGVRAIRSF